MRPHTKAGAAVTRSDAQAAVPDYHQYPSCRRSVLRILLLSVLTGHKIILSSRIVPPNGCLILHGSIFFLLGKPGWPRLRACFGGRPCLHAPLIFSGPFFFQFF